MSSRIPQPKQEANISFVSLGMVVIDEIRLPSRPPIIDVAGGSATYAMLGCRIFAGSAQSRDVGCVVLAGQDFPAAITNELESWDLSLLKIEYADQLSTRGLLEYADDTFGSKTFAYTAPPLKPSPAHLIGSPLLRSSAFHLLATPQEIIEQIPELLSLRARSGIQTRPYIVWEPLPASCIPSNRESYLEACEMVDVFSPNHHEMTALFSDNPSQQHENFSAETLEKYARVFAQRVATKASGPGHGAVVIRAGEHGALTLTTDGHTHVRWLPAFYKERSTKIVDATGAGNMFLGGFVAGWQCARDVEEAAVWGIVAASFAVEQIGLPVCCVEGERERWNGESVVERLRGYKARLEGLLERQ